MNIFAILFLELCCLKYGYAGSNNDCSASQSAYPPDQSSGCCGVDVSSYKRAGRLQAAIDEYPWLALVEYSREGSTKMEALCGGTLISVKYVLTAAHCVTGLALVSKKPTNIILGEYNKTHSGPDCDFDLGFEDCTEGETRIPIKTITPHPQYNTKEATKGNDIALIRMKQRAPYTDFIRPICLPTEDVTARGGWLSLTMAGWGTAYGPSDVKLHVNLPFVPRDKCEAAYTSRRPLLNLQKGQICAGGEKGKDSCQGDGGMPLMYRYVDKFVVVGTVSFGSFPCGQENVPSVYTNVYEFKSWITSNITP